MAEELERQEADRKLQAEKLKNKMEVRKWVIRVLWPIICGYFVGALWARCRNRVWWNSAFPGDFFSEKGNRWPIAVTRVTAFREISLPQ